MWLELAPPGAVFDKASTALPDHADRLAALPLWGGPITIEPMVGGLTNRNLMITAPAGRFVARIAGDNAIHGIDRRAEQEATRAAAASGLGPELAWAEPGLMILRHIEGTTLGRTDFGEWARLRRVLDLLNRIRRELPGHYRRTPRDRRPVVILADYLERLSAKPNRWRRAAEDHRPLLESLTKRLAVLPPGFAHNDIHGDNIIDDGRRLWLVDWEYAGQGQPLCDLASFVNNAQLDEEAARRCLAYWLDRPATQGDDQGFAAMRLAAALRDLFWGYAQDGLIAGQPGRLDDYIAINEGRVRVAAARL